MTKTPAALEPATLPEVRGTTYPEPFKSRLGDRAKRRLGDAFGLTQFGVNLVTLGPGGQSALRHWHTHEDEFVWVLEGELVLVTDAGETPLRAGMCAGYRAGSTDAHHMLNRSARPARYLEVGTRDPRDAARYPDDDLEWIDRATGQPAPYAAPGTVAGHKDGRPY